MSSWLPGQKKGAGGLRLVAEVKLPAGADGRPASPPSWVRELWSQYCQRARVLKDWQDENRDPAAGTDVSYIRCPLLTLLALIAPVVLLLLFVFVVPA